MIDKKENGWMVFKAWKFNPQIKQPAVNRVFESEVEARELAVSLGEQNSSRIFTVKPVTE